MIITCNRLEIVVVHGTPCEIPPLNCKYLFHFLHVGYHDISHLHNFTALLASHLLNIELYLQ